MKRYIIFICSVLLLISNIAYAAINYKANVFASTVSVDSTNSNVGIDLPFNSRSITIINGSSNEIFVDFKNSTRTEDDITVGSVTTGCIIDGDKTFTLRDYVTDKMSFVRAGNDASPVTVIITY